MSDSQSSKVHRDLVSFRRCHLCGCTNEEDHGQTIIRCQHCKKSLAPFYYFNDKLVSAASENGMRPTGMHPGYQPIQGLTAYW